MKLYHPANTTIWHLDTTLRNGKRFRKSTGERDESKANVAAYNLLQAKEGNLPVEKVSVQGVLAPTLLIPALQTHKLPASMEEKRYVLCSFSDYMQENYPNLRVDKVVPPMIHDWIERCVRPGRSNGTVVNYKNLISKFFTESQKRGYCFGNPASRMGLKGNDTIKVGLTEQNRDEVLERSKQFPTLRRAYMIAFFAGAEVQAMSDLEWKHVNWDKNEIYIPGTKTNVRAAWIPMFPELKDFLLPLRQESGFVFTKKSGDKTPRLLRSRKLCVDG